MSLKIGFIGLGLMGRPCAQNIAKKGFPLFVYNRTPKKGLPGTVCASVAEVASKVDVLITMVTGPKDVEQVLDQAKLRKGQTVIDMSTIGPQAAKQIAGSLAKRGIQFIDAPVTGGTWGAEAGTLTIFAGGKKAIFNKVKPILQAMGKDVFYIGETGMGQAIKLVNNALVGSTLVALSEAFLLADAQKLPRKKIVQYLANVPAVSSMMKVKMPNMVSGKYKTAFSVSNMHKDLELAVEEVKKAQKTLPELELTTKLYKKAKDQDLAQADNSAILKVLDV